MVRRTSRRAFTLIELLLVLVILAVLAAVVIPKLTGRVQDSKIKATISQIDQIKTALGTYETDNGAYPDPADGLSALVYKPANAGGNWHQLMEQLPKDAWGNEFKYELVDDGNGGTSFDITSGGPNGSMGDDDDISLLKK
jgi:general secretion pathway protein G